jgi:hypothetical protein
MDDFYKVNEDGYLYYNFLFFMILNAYVSSRVIK